MIYIKQFVFGMNIAKALLKVFFRSLSGVSFSTNRGSLEAENVTKFMIFMRQISVKILPSHFLFSLVCESN